MGKLQLNKTPRGKGKWNGQERSWRLFTSIKLQYKDLNRNSIASNTTGTFITRRDELSMEPWHRSVWPCEHVFSDAKRLANAVLVDEDGLTVPTTQRRRSILWSRRTIVGDLTGKWRETDMEGMKHHTVVIMNHRGVKNHGSRGRASYPPIAP